MTLTLNAVEAVTLDNPVLFGEGADPHGVRGVLEQFNDVLVSAIPGGLPPERFDTERIPIEHIIEVDPDAGMFKRSPRPSTAEEDAEIQRYLQDFLAKGWVIPSLSPWAAHVLSVQKKIDPVTGKSTRRMCISFVKLNSKTLNRTACRLPRISDLLERIDGASCFSKLDLPDGYYQVRMRASHVSKTAFTTRYGNFEFKVMPIGLCGAPSTFQYLMDNTFYSDIRLSDGTVVSARKIIAIYLEDICIFSVTEHEHLMHIHDVLQRLRTCFLSNLASVNGCSVQLNPMHTGELGNSSRHHRKGTPRVKSHNTNQHSSRARLHHRKLPPSLCTPSRVIARSSQSTQPNAKYKRAEPSYGTVWCTINIPILDGHCFFL